MAYTIPWNLLGIGVSGDVAGYTIYTNQAGKKVAFPKAPPEKPPSSQQTKARARFKTAQANWKALTAAEKLDLETACRDLSMPLTGQNLYISVSLTNNFDAFRTVERQSKISLPTPVFVP